MMNTDTDLMLVRFGIPSGHPNLPAWLCPSGNGIGLFLVGRALDHALEKAGLLGDEFAGAWYGELNCGMVLLTVKDWRGAVEPIRAELEVCGLSGFAVIARFDPAEIVWRVAWPGQSAGDVMEMPDLKTIAAALREHRERIGAAMGVIGD